MRVSVKRSNAINLEEAELMLDAATIARIRDEVSRRKALLDERLTRIAERKRSRTSKAVSRDSGGDAASGGRGKRRISSLAAAGNSGAALTGEMEQEQQTIPTEGRRTARKPRRSASGSESAQDPLAQARKAARRLKPGITDEELRAIGLLP